MIVVIPTAKKADKMRRIARKHTSSICKRQGGLCAYCNKPMKVHLIGVHIEFQAQDDDRPTIEHVRPLGRGGQNNVENLCVIHYKCNQLLAQMEEHTGLQFGMGAYA